MKVGKIIVGKQGEDSEQYEELCKIANEKEIPVIIAQKGDNINIEKDLKIKILFPTDELIKENVLNNNSLVAKLEYKDFKMLFTGDIEAIAERELMKFYSSNELEANIIKVPHHRFKDFFNRGIFKSSFTNYCYNRSR